MPYRVAILGIYHESNTFIDSRTSLADFRHGHWLRGDTIRTEYKDAYHEIGGMIEVLESAQVEVVPVMFGEATPGGIIEAEAFETLFTEMMRLLEEVLPVDGCLVVPHGAAVSEKARDMDGYWLSRLRERVGDTVPVIGTLDPHANVSQQMTDACDGLIPYRTNPHIDQRETGRRVASLMLGRLGGRCFPTQMLRPLPVAISIEQQETAAEPCRALYDYARELERRPGILSVGICLGFPYADVPEMGSSVMVVSDRNRPAALQVADELEAYVRGHHHQFSGPKLPITEVFQSLPSSERPILLLDMGDNVGGGAPGNSLALLKALEESGRWKGFICLHDPSAVKWASRHRKDSSFGVALTGAIGERYVVPVSVDYFGDGKFSETAPRHGGQQHYDMGDIAILRTRAGTVVMVTTLRVSPFSLRQLTSFGIELSGFDVVVAKGVNAPVAAYAPVCKTIIRVDTPGVTQADMTRFKYQYRRKPLFPFERLS